MAMKKLQVILLLIISFCFTFCSKNEPKTSNEKTIEVDVDMENEYLNVSETKQKGSAFKGDYFSSVDSVRVYGAGYSLKINDTLKGYNLQVLVSAWLREVNSPNEGSIGFSLNDQSGAVKNWKALSIEKNNFKANEWVNITDTVEFEGELTRQASELRIFAMKQNGSDKLDVDNLNIKYRFYK